MPTINTKQVKVPWVTPARKSKKSWGFDTQFYRRKKWINLRRFFLSRNPFCAECEKNGELISATVVDHKIPRKERKDLEYELDNLQGLCESCHNSKSSREGRGGQNSKNGPSLNR
ncbi:hypothetical protein DN752_19575 [Echinicola strongylocentroti]|uniref:Putative HNH nuclease YajD n=1 Tax=Echinicola strongylocentroti TaxID=1795355 RepID=A0A2Z4IM16_9BACT|nr:hypothetical protein DN752_19575 [Echinicola strongylocentroti]